jgi:hypothetical protein
MLAMPPCPAGEIPVAIAASVTIAVGEALAPSLVVTHTPAVAAVRTLLTEFPALTQPLLALFGARLARLVTLAALLLRQLITAAFAVLSILPVFLPQPGLQLLPFLPLLCAQLLARGTIQVPVVQLLTLSRLQFTQLAAIALALYALLLALADKFAPLGALHARRAVAPDFATLPSAAAKGAWAATAATAKDVASAAATSAAAESSTASTPSTAEGSAASTPSAAEGSAASTPSAAEGSAASTPSAAEGFAASTAATANTAAATSSTAATTATSSAALTGRKIGGRRGIGCGVLLRVCRKGQQQQHKRDWNKGAKHRHRPDCITRPDKIKRQLA